MAIKKNIFRELRLKFTIALILAVCLGFFMLYHQLSSRKQFRSQSELILLEIGKDYEYEISSELNKFSALADLLSLSLSKNYMENDYKSNAKSILKNILYNNQRLQSITLVMNSNTVETDSIVQLFSFKDSLTDNIIRFNKLKSDIVEDFTSNEFLSTSSKVSIKKAIVEDHVTILEPEIKVVEGNSISVIPIVAGLYSGKQYLGYILLHVSIDWIDESKQNFISADKLETFVSTGQGKVFALNNNEYLLSEPISKVCFSCEDLLNEKGTVYNVFSDRNYTTLCFPVDLSKSFNNWHICLRCKKDVLYEKIGYGKFNSWLIVFFLYVLGVFVIFLFIEKSEAFWQDLFKMSTGILTGSLNKKDLEEVETNLSNYGRLKSTLIKIAKVSQTTILSNRKIKSGDYSEKFSNEELQYELIRSADEIRTHINQMNEKYLQNFQELTQIKEFNNGQEKIQEILQLHYRNLKVLSEKIIISLVDLLQISMGAVYLAKTENNDTWLELIVSYAYNESRYQKRSFKLGESLVGACAAEQRTIHLKKIPENYLSIMSGLGLASPKSILIVPLIFESKVLGVIELGSISDFDDYQIRFSETASAKIASTVSLTQKDIITSELIEKSRIQTIELEERDKETFRALNQLKELHDKTAKSEINVRSKLEAMNNTLMMVEYTTQGVLLDANYKFLNAMQYNLDEIKGKNVLDLLKDDEQEELTKIIESVKAGNFFEGLVHRHTKLGNEKWFLATYTPVYDEEGLVESILFFAIDITRIKTKEDQLVKKADELAKHVSDLRNQIKS